MALRRTTEPAHGEMYLSHKLYASFLKPAGLEVVKLEFILKLKIKPVIALYFDLENVLELYNLEACMHSYLEGWGGGGLEA